MSHKFLLNASFHLLLNSIDRDIADQAKQKGCSICGGPLYQADYPRSPMGVPPPFREYYDNRFSTCCGLCRKRATPPSVRFFGRRWFPAPLLLLISALVHGPTDYRCNQILRLFGVRVSPSTWKRWRRWWRFSFIETAFFRQAQGLLPIALLSATPFPRSLLVIFSGCLEERLILSLKFLAPLTAGVLRAV